MDEQPMKLSEAIREGAKKRPQAFRGFFRTVNGQLCSCALGAAYEAATGKAIEDADTDDIAYGLEDAIGINPFELDAPVAGWEYALGNYIEHLNDGLKHSREQIADWLQSIGY